MLLLAAYTYTATPPFVEGSPAPATALRPCTKSTSSPSPGIGKGLGTVSQRVGWRRQGHALPAELVGVHNVELVVEPARIGRLQRQVRDSGLRAIEPAARVSAGSEFANAHRLRRTCAGCAGAGR